jgi:hypothetical protein
VRAPRPPPFGPVRLTLVRCVTCFRPSPPPSTLVRDSTTREWRNGRRAGLRIRCPQGRGSSTLPSRTASDLRIFPSDHRGPGCRAAVLLTLAHRSHLASHPIGRSRTGWRPTHPLADDIGPDIRGHMSTRSSSRCQTVCLRIKQEVKLLDERNEQEQSGEAIDLRVLLVRDAMGGGVSAERSRYGVAAVRVVPLQAE